MGTNFYTDYAQRLAQMLQKQDWGSVAELTEDLRRAWAKGSQVFLCGNGGSAANAIHLANDFIYGVAKQGRQGIRAVALPANQSVMTCLANDTCYDEVFSWQLAVLGRAGDMLIVFSGSGNSPNVIRAIEKAREMGIKTYAILGYSGGRCLELADRSIHFSLDDMQISEDCQQVVGHMVMRQLCELGPAAGQEG